MPEWLPPAVLWAIAPALAPAATLVVSPQSTAPNYSGGVSLQIGGLTNNETVLVERFLDLNGNGSIEPGEPLVQSFRVTDGVVTAFGGIKDKDIPGDTDSNPDGQITAKLNFAQGAEFTRASASQLFRVSSPSGRFAPVVQSFTVTAGTFAQHITGVITSNGTNLPNAMVAALTPSGDSEILVSAAVADATGHFSLAVSNGTYAVLGFAKGYYGNFGLAPFVTLANNDTNVTLGLLPGAIQVSGQVIETSSNTGVAGVQLLISSDDNNYAVMFSDAQGNFGGPLTTGQWKIDLADGTLMLGGYYQPQSKIRFSVASTPVAGITVPLIKANSLIYGTVLDDQSHPLANVLLSATDSSNTYQTGTLSDTNGNYYLAVGGGTWFVGQDGSGQGLPPGDLLQGGQQTVTDGTSASLNLVATHAAATLSGFAYTGNMVPLSGGSIVAFGSNGPNNINANVGGDGSFSMGLPAGSWTLSLDSQTSASFGLVPPQLSVQVVNGVNISNIIYVAPAATRTISGTVKTTANAPLPNLNVFAGAFINGTNYNANATTDANGNFSLPVLPGVWNLGLDTSGLAQLGYAPAANQSVNTLSGNQQLTLTVGRTRGTLTFRHTTGVIGEFGNSATAHVGFPVMVRNFRAIFRAIGETNPPSTAEVLFTGPPGSGLTNSPADDGAGAIPDGNDTVFFSLPVRSPALATGGSWTITYRGAQIGLFVPDPQVASHLAVPVPTVIVSNDLIRGVSWTYRDSGGNTIFGTPAYILTNRVDLFDQNGNGLDAEVFPVSASFIYPSTNLFHWSDISMVRVNYFDNLTNQYFFAYSESSPSLKEMPRSPGSPFQFQLNGQPGQNYTIQFSTNLALGGWSTLFVTNFVQSPVAIVDPTPLSAKSKFYRVLLGP